MPTLFALDLVINNDNYISTPSLAAMISAAQKIQDWQTLNEVLNHHCNLDLEYINPIC